MPMVSTHTNVEHSDNKSIASVSEPVDPPRRLRSDDRLTPGAPFAQRQLLERLRFSGPDRSPFRLFLYLGDPEVRDDGAENHGRAEHNENSAVAPRLVVARGRGAEFVVKGEYLHED